jgi:phosphate transport system permease protein
MSAVVPPVQARKPGTAAAWLRLGDGQSQVADRLFQAIVGSTAATIVLLAVVLAITMIQSGFAAFRAFGPAFVWTTQWNPVTHVFGVLPAIYGTATTSLIALLIALPIGVGAAIFLAELAPPWLAHPIAFLIEMLAAIPSVIIGLWGLFVLVPIVRQLEAALGQSLGVLPSFSGPAYGIGLLAASVLLSIMVLPILTAVTRDVLRAVPNSQREAMLALGATRWEMIWHAVLPYGRSGIIGAIILGLGRALGETLAVSMVIGNTFQISPSLYAPATTLASLIATQFREADTALYLSALIAAGFVLFLITMAVNILARLLIWKLTMRTGEP